MPTEAALCTRCGQRITAGGASQLQTSVARPEERGPLPPAVGSVRWRNQRAGEYSDRIPLIKCTVWIVLGLVVASVLRAMNPGVSDLGPFLGRFSILCGLGVVLSLAASLTFMDTQVSWPVFVLGVAGGLAGAEMAQHIIRDAMPFFALVAWPVGFVVCAGVLTDLLDVEITEGAFLALGLFLLKLFLKWSLFTHFLPPP